MRSGGNRRWVPLLICTVAHRGHAANKKVAAN